MAIELVVGIIGILLLFLVGMVVIVAKFYRKVEQGKALIVNTMKSEPIVTFTGAVVYPIIHRAEVMDISVKVLEINRRGKDGLICKDNIRADISVNFFVRVNKTAGDVLQVANMIGCVRASDQPTLETLFTAKFSEALKTIGKQFDFEELYNKREDFRNDIIGIIGEDLNGYMLEDCAIDYLEQTPKTHLDPDNILDSQGIRKITKITAQQKVFTNEFEQEEKKAIKKQNVSAAEAIMALERQEADARARQQREIEIVRAHEISETKQVKFEEHRKAEEARIKVEEELAKLEEVKAQEIAIAQKIREKRVGVETERVLKEKELEQVKRIREVDIQTILKDKALEVETKNICDVKRERIAVEKTVAEEEERIKDLRALAEAKRDKEVMIIGAEAEAQEKLVKDIKAAEAREEVAKYIAKERLIHADAELQASDKQTKATIRTAEGTQAKAAAVGLGEVRVKEANAGAVEKIGRAEANVRLQKMQAEATGEEKKGFARVNVREAEAQAIEKQGLAEARVIREKLLSEAAGNEEKGMATVRVSEAEAQAIEKQGLAKATIKQADADATEKMGLAESVSIREKGLSEAIGVKEMGLAKAAGVREHLAAEAAGLAEKAAAMKDLDGVGKEHEEFRLSLEKQKEVEIAAIQIRKDVAASQALVLKEAFSAAKINIVGGDGAFFEQFIRAVSVGQTFDGFVNNSSMKRFA